MRRLSYEVKNGVVQAKLLERHIVREIIDRLWYQAHIKVWIINQPVNGKTAQNAPGIPDLIGHFRVEKSHEQGVDGHGIVRCRWWETIPLYIEVKRPGGKRREMQKRFIEEAKAGGCIAFFAESWSDVVRELQGCGIKLKEID